MKEGALAGQRCLVTGGARGIGLELTKGLLSQGASVAILDKDGAKTNEVVSSLGAAGGDVRAIVFDLAEYASIVGVLGKFISDFGGFDILVNNAGLSLARSFLETTPSDLERSVQVNLFGSFFCAQAVSPFMMERRFGRILNIASHSGLLGSSNRAAYAASKGAVIAATRVMAVELAEFGVTVNAIAPGPIETEQTSTRHTGDRKQKWQAAVPMKRYGTMSEVVAAALFLVSPAASFITGQTIAVDGGFTQAGLLVGH